MILGFLRFSSVLRRITRKRHGVGKLMESVEENSSTNLADMPPVERTSETSHLVPPNSTSPPSYLNLASNLCALLFISIIIYCCFGDGVSLFSFHPSLMSLGWLMIMTSAINAITPGDLATEWMPIRLRSARHWVLQLLAVTIITIGFIVILSNKIINNKPHFVTLHAKFGLASLIFMSLTSLGDELSASVQKLPQPWLLMYADVIALVDGDKGRLTRRVHAWREALENGGLKLNVAKTEYMVCNNTDLTSLRIGDDTVERTDNFRYLGSVLDASGDIDRDIKARISAAWAKWREVTVVICDPKMPVKLKGQVYKTIIRPVLTYGSEAWPVLERHRQLLHVTEMNILRWMCGVTRKDHVWNTYIRGSLHILDIANKL
ncbi:unnamed protein product [Parnassius apollo]|uniref:(apollo) hypothetical protein n=1 Tax=Parnassius apollo TaxID=110799 RepID=A0A8S3X8G0_PARAO|nr:unnamed protein product [Parnassius apollo]